MPFTKITTGPNKGKFRSPSGKILTAEQVQAYYAKTKTAGHTKNATKDSKRDPSYKKLGKKSRG